MRGYLLIVILLAVIVFSGCSAPAAKMLNQSIAAHNNLTLENESAEAFNMTLQESEKPIKFFNHSQLEVDLNPDDLSRLKYFLQINQKANVSLTFWNETAVNESLDTIRANCGPNFQVRNYSRLRFSNPKSTLIIWYNAQNSQIACINTASEVSLPQICIGGYTDNYKCSNTHTINREYRYSDCSTEWREWDTCEDICSLGKCLSIPKPINRPAVNTTNLTTTTFEEIVSGRFNSASNKYGKNGTLVIVHNVTIYDVEFEIDGDWHFTASNGNIGRFIMEVIPRDQAIGRPNLPIKTSVVGVPFCDYPHQFEAWHGRTCWELHPLLQWEPDAA